MDDWTQEQRWAAISAILRQWPIAELVQQADEDDDNPFDHLFDADIV